MTGTQILKVLIADDHAITRRGLREILQDEFGEIEVEEAEDSNSTLEKVVESDWDILLLDVIMPGMNVVTLLESIRKERPKLPILVLSAILEAECAVRTVKAGAKGYITKQRAADELVEAVKIVLSGEVYLSGDAITHMAASLQGDVPNLPHQKLSNREFQVFRLIAKGMTLKEIGGILEISDKTVGTYLTRIKEKTGLISYVEIARYAMLHQLVD